MGFSFGDFVNEINPTRKSGFVGGIFNDSTVKQITSGLTKPLLNGLSFMNNFSGNLQKTALGVSGLLTGETLYLILIVGGGVVVYSVIRKM